MPRVISFISILLFSLIVNAQPAVPLFTCSNKLINPYGFCAHVTRKGYRYDYWSMESQMKLFKEIGANNVRSDIDYGTINTSGKGLLDSVLLSASSRCINFLGIAYDLELYKPSWKENSSFVSYLETLKKCYSNKLQYIEFFNEVNYCNQPSLSYHYIDDLRRVYKLKGQNKNLKILFSGIYDPKGLFLDSMMRDKAYLYFDIMNLHIYPDNENQLIHLFKTLKSNMDKYSWSKPVWITETGMNTAEYDKLNTNHEFFTKVVPMALKHLTLYYKNIHYGILRDSEKGYATLTDDETYNYITNLGFSPTYINFAKLQNISIKDLPVLVVTGSEGFPAKYFPLILDYVKRGGTIILPYGAPFYYDSSENGWKSVGDLYARQLHIGELFWWTNKAKTLNAQEMPSLVKPNKKFGYSYTYRFDKRSGKTARYLTKDNLKDKDEMIPITYAGNEKYMGVVAALYKLNSDLKGNIIIQTRLNTQRYVDKEQEQARRVARFYLTSFAYGIDKVFWYKFRSCELDSTYSEDYFGVVHKDLSPKPAFYAYKTMTTMCPSGSTRPTLTINGDIYTSSWKKTDGTKVTAKWSPNGICYIDLPIQSVKIYDYLGKPVRLQRKGKLMITSGITYIIGER